MLSGAGTQGNRQKVMHMKSQLNIRKNFPMWVTKDRNGLPTKGAETFSLDIFHLGTILLYCKR